MHMKLIIQTFSDVVRKPIHSFFLSSYTLSLSWKKGGQRQRDDVRWY